jgi:hypothetical protein
MANINANKKLFITPCSIQKRLEATPGEIGEELIDELKAETEEQNRRDVLKEIAESLQVQHPIIYDAYDLCDMNNRNKLQVFNVSMP